MRAIRIIVLVYLAGCPTLITIYYAESLRPDITGQRKRHPAWSGSPLSNLPHPFRKVIFPNNCKLHFSHKQNHKCSNLCSNASFWGEFSFIFWENTFMKKGEALPGIYPEYIVCEYGSDHRWGSLSLSG